MFKSLSNIKTFKSNLSIRNNVSIIRKAYHTNVVSNKKYENG